MTSRSFLFKQKIPFTQLIGDEVESAREMYRAMLIDSSPYEYCFLIISPILGWIYSCEECVGISITNVYFPD